MSSLLSQLEKLSMVSNFRALVSPLSVRTLAVRSFDTEGILLSVYNLSPLERKLSITMFT